MGGLEAACTDWTGQDRATRASQAAQVGGATHPSKHGLSDLNRSFGWGVRGIVSSCTTKRISGGSDQSNLEPSRHGVGVLVLEATNGDLDLSSIDLVTSS